MLAKYITLKYSRSQETPSFPTTLQDQGGPLGLGRIQVVRRVAFPI